MIKKLILLIVLLAFGQATQAVTQEWVAIYNIGAGTADYPKDIAVDSSGNVYVTGYSGQDGWCVTTVKYDSAGNQLWAQNYNYNPGSNFGDWANAIALDSSGNVYVTGASDTGTNQEDVLTIKYATDGTFQWASTYNGGANGYDEGHDIAVNSGTGDVYVTGRSGGNLFIIRYDSAGVQQFVRIYGGTLGCGYGIALNGSGDVYATGTDGAQYTTIKCTADLTSELWFVTYGSGTAYGIAVDSSGDAYVTGQSSGACATVKYDNAFGTQLWAQTYTGGTNNLGEAIVVDSSGNAYVTGATDNAAGTDYLTIMYDTTGSQQWVSTYDAAGLTDKAHGIAIDGETPPNVYITGESDGGTSSWDFATIMYNNSGVQQWAMRYNGLGNNSDKGRAIAVYDKDNIYVTGESIDSNYDYATVKYSQRTSKIVKWEQLPDLSEMGIDVKATEPFILADDFNCTNTGPITEITVWGSWLYDILPPCGPHDVGFTLSIHKDIPDPDPQNPDDYSMPGDVEWIHIVEPGTYQVEVEADEILEGWMNPETQEYIFPADTICWKYTFKIDPNTAFVQQGEPNAPIVYWLDVQAHPNDPNGEALFGWKTSITHWNDDAVWGDGVEPYLGPWYELRYPPGHELYPESIDLAFRIVTEEEPEPNEPEDPNLKYLQRPDKTETGIDIRFDRNDGIMRTLADDFPCDTPGRITDVHLWCSWLDDIKGEVEMIHISIHDDIPASQSSTGYSMPGNLLWERDVTPAEFNETLYYTLPEGQYEWWWDPYIPVVIPQGDTQIWKYDIYIPWDDAFEQTGEPNNPKVYWLDAWVMLTPDSPPEAQMGWKTSVDHWNDAAVYEDPTGLGWINLLYPIDHPYEETNVDLAFAITTMPECFPGGPGDPLYDEWALVGKPSCWCASVNPRQCHGDADGEPYGKGNYWTSYNDLTVLKAAWNKNYAQIAGQIAGTPTTSLICADFDHLPYGKGNYRVSYPDLDILKANWNQTDKPDPNCALKGY